MQVLQFCRVAIEDGEAILSNDSANDVNKQQSEQRVQNAGSAILPSRERVK